MGCLGKKPRDCNALCLTGASSRGGKTKSVNRRDQALLRRPHAVARARPVCCSAEHEPDSVVVGFFYTLPASNSGFMVIYMNCKMFFILERKLLAFC